MGLGLGFTFVPMTLIATTNVAPAMPGSRPACSTPRSRSAERWDSRSCRPSPPTARQTISAHSATFRRRRLVDALVSGYHVGFLAGAGCCCSASRCRPRSSAIATWKRSTKCRLTPRLQRPSTSRRENCSPCSRAKRAECHEGGGGVEARPAPRPRGGRPLRSRSPVGLDSAGIIGYMRWRWGLLAVVVLAAPAVPARPPTGRRRVAARSIKALPWARARSRSRRPATCMSRGAGRSATIRSSRRTSAVPSSRADASSLQSRLGRSSGRSAPPTGQLSGTAVSVPTRGRCRWLRAGSSTCRAAARSGR